MEHLVFGHAGAPVLVFPTSSGRFYQWEDFGMVAALERHLANGWVQLFCIESLDAESWYNFAADQRDQLDAHMDYESYVIEEFLPYLRSVNSTDYLIVTGTSFGAFHAVNFSFRHPELVDRVIAMSGDYDSKKYVDGYFDLDVYYNSPVDFLGNMTDPYYLEQFRNRLDVILAAGDWDFCLGPTLDLSGILKRLEVPHFLDVWGDHSLHDWPLWRRMIAKFI